MSEPVDTTLYQGLSVSRDASNPFREGLAVGNQEALTVARAGESPSATEIPAMFAQSPVLQPAHSTDTSTVHTSRLTQSPAPLSCASSEGDQ